MASGALPFAARLYRLAGYLATPLAPVLLGLRAARGKEDTTRRGERLGRTGVARPAGPVVWLHGASIGEAVSALALCEAMIRAAGVSVVFTTGTVTSARIVQDRLPAGAIHQFVPLDLPGAARRFLDHWRPDLAVFIESEIWPTLLRGLSTRNIPAVLVNARISARSQARWLKLRPFARSVFGVFALITAQSAADADRLRHLTDVPVEMPGNLKYDADPPPVDPDDLATARAAVGERPVVAAASTHTGEDETILAAHLALKERFGGLLTVLAPRHPQRGDQISVLAEGMGLSVARRSAGALPSPDTDVWLVDTVGDLGLVYALAPIAFCGGSLIEHGGQNPIEPARAGRAIVHGPHVFNFAEVFATLDQARAAVRLDSEAAYLPILTDLLAHPERVAEMGASAEAAVSRLTGATARTIDLIRPLLPGGGA
ncbi:MAG: 3-deoxy-D-manno-octulosonic acid transferase [Rhodobiaceae bacterium]|nr:3-deoxy-D-manno-octulosonic acid transferase [Rhodobiaceae bacterium]